LEQEIARLLTLELVKKSGERYRTDHKNEQKYDSSKAVLLDRCSPPRSDGVGTPPTRLPEIVARESLIIAEVKALVA
jgi:hypothetical protein